jgi:hypothetical protein
VLVGRAAMHSVARLGYGDRLTGGHEGVHREEPSSENTRIGVGDDRPCQIGCSDGSLGQTV